VRRSASSPSAEPRPGGSAARTQVGRGDGDIGPPVHGISPGSPVAWRGGGGGGGGGPTSTQGSDNELSSGQAVGSPGGGDVFIAPSGSGPTQLNQQGANTEQGSANGAIGLQGSKNGLANSQIVGGDQSCLPPAGCASSVIIGSPTQVNEQGANLTQGADGGVVSGDIIITPGVVINGPAGPIVQLSFQPITSSQIVLG
jgi:hypothetical protein